MEEITKKMKRLSNQAQLDHQKIGMLMDCMNVVERLEKDVEMLQHNGLQKHQEDREFYSQATRFEQMPISFAATKPARSQSESKYASPRACRILHPQTRSEDGELPSKHLQVDADGFALVVFDSSTFAVFGKQGDSHEEDESPKPEQESKNLEGKDELDMSCVLVGSADCTLGPFESTLDEVE